MLTDEQIKALLEGCEGVTPGPWEPKYFDDGSHTVEAIREIGGFYVAEEILGSLDAAHIARCNPTTIAELCKEVLAWRESFPGYANREQSK
jgi:hypothetical protein